MAELGNAGQDANLVYDVGMHKGEDTDYYLKKGFRVIGFEADPDLVAVCRSRFAEEIDDGRLIIVNGAISDVIYDKNSAKTIKFYKNKDHSVWGTVSGDWANRNKDLGTASEIIEVSVVDFSRCLQKFGIPYYLKTDIEGMDMICLNSLNSFDERPSYVSIESDKVRYDKLTEEIDLLVRLGYTKFKAVQQLSIPDQQEPNPSKEGRHIGYQFEFGSSGLFGEDLPGEWKGRDQILREYRMIFVIYRLFGDYGILGESILGRVLKKLSSIILRRPIPGWYDTHAKHGSIDP